MTEFFAPQFFDGHTLLADVTFAVADGKVVSVTPNTTAGAAQVLNSLVAPGMVDVQVNGGGGVQVNDAPTPATWQTLADAHRVHGTTSVLPTVITDDLVIMQRAADTQASMHQTDPARFVGIHFEGPHLSQAKKGMHSSAHVRGLGEAEKQLFTRKDLGQVVVTVAPETVSAQEIRWLVRQGVIVSLGHTNASYEQASAAMAAGATGVTHLYNAMSALTSREPGVVGCGLYEKDVFCGLIVDLEHVHPVSATLAMQAKGPDRLMLVTDAMGPAASDTDYFDYQGTRVTRQGNTLRLADGTLAGSCLTMQQAIANTYLTLGQPLDATLAMATSTPAAFLGRPEIGSLQTGATANFILLDSALNVTACWQNGEPVSI